MATRSYRLVVEGELGPRYSSAFVGMTLSAHDGTTEIVGPITDSAHLQGMLERIAALGLTLHSVAPLDAEDAGGGVQRHKAAKSGRWSTNGGGARPHGGSEAPR